MCGSIVNLGRALPFKFSFRASPRLRICRRSAQIGVWKGVRQYQDENWRGSETILLVEEAAPLRKLAVSFLSSHGFEVLSAPDAEEALKIAAAHAGAIQLLVTDVVMPGQNGRVLAERL